ncbi:MAG: hypothetical protein QF786_09265, partial [Vicinamibacterales bacterium]|nr:hypothetical protein [Vicinamibacterales bacterium]
MEHPGSFSAPQTPSSRRIDQSRDRLGNTNGIHQLDGGFRERPVELWHSDVSCDVEPPMGSILRIEQVPT